MSLDAPFPYFGGKSAVSGLVWELLGNPTNYIEPFAGSMSVLLRRPGKGTVETVNDRSHWIANFWRAVKSDPDSVAKFADNPVVECDMFARHRALMSEGPQMDQMLSDPEWFDAKLAGWWVWGQCLWIGSGWCEEGQQNGKRPSLGHRGGRGILNHIGDSNGWDSNSSERRLGFIRSWMRRLQDRLRNVRVCHGNWSRVCSSESVLGELGLTGVVLDPPYCKSVDRLNEWKSKLSGSEIDVKKAKCGNRAKSLYLGDDSDVDRLVADVNLWCRQMGPDPNMRIVVCGLDGEHNDLEQLGWKSISWTTNGGLGNLSSDNVNRHRERLWASPSCLEAMDELPLFANANSA